MSQHLFQRGHLLSRHQSHRAIHTVGYFRNRYCHCRKPVGVAVVSVEVEWTVVEQFAVAAQARMALTVAACALPLCIPGSVYLYNCPIGIPQRNVKSTKSQLTRIK